MAHPADVNNDGRIGIGEAWAAHEAFDPTMKSLGSRGSPGGPPSPAPRAGCGWTCGVVVAFFLAAALVVGLLIILFVPNS